jgi:hypothetical protein
MTANANTMQEASESNGTALSLVAEPCGQLTTHDVAQRLSKSLAWVKKHARELGGTIVDGAYQFPSVEIERRRTVTTSEKFTLGGQRAAEPPDLGRRAAAVLERLETGAQAVRIAIELQEPPDFVLRVREQWLRAHAADREGLAFTCECGAPSHPASARCMRCHARSRVLSEADAALLAGRPAPEPNTCQCRGCGARVPTANATAICGTCEPTMSVRVEAGAVAIVVAGNVLRTLTSAEVKALATALTPAARVVVPMPTELPPLERPPPPPPAVEDPVAQLEALLAQAEREHEVERNAPK